MWSILNWNINYVHRRQELRNRQKRERHQIQLAVALAWHQLEQGLLFFIENPVLSRLWWLPEVLALLADPRVYVRTGQGCAYGLLGRGGKLMKKTWRFVTNDPGLAEALSHKCPGVSPWHQHEVCQGSSTTGSQNYPIRLARAVLRRVRALVIRRGDALRYLPDEKPTMFNWQVSCGLDAWEPAGLFDSPLEAEVFYLDAVKDHVVWRRLLEAAEKWVGNSADRSRNLPEASELYKQVNTLCPWDLARVQICRTPAARRFPTNLTKPFTHRAHILWYADDTIDIETEALKDLSLIHI